jgi:RNA polymerase sigma factor (sigma-70 family)
MGDGVQQREVALTRADRPFEEPTGFAEWVAPYVRMLVALAVREVGRSDAEDVVQDALVRAWRRRATFDPDRGTARVWLVAVLLDQARRHRLRRLRRMSLAAADSAEADSAEAVLVPADAARVDLDRAVRALPRRQRQVITLFYLADLSVAEVASVLGITAGSVKSHLHDARQSLRVALEER